MKMLRAACLAGVSVTLLTASVPAMAQGFGYGDRFHHGYGGEFHHGYGYGGPFHRGYGYHRGPFGFGFGHRGFHRGFDRY